MNTNHAGVKENAFANIDKEKFDANYVHIFQKDKCECPDCMKKREETGEAQASPPSPE